MRGVWKVFARKGEQNKMVGALSGNGWKLYYIEDFLDIPHDAA